MVLNRHLLREALRPTRCRLHAYVLMDNHVHLLATPPEAGALAQLMRKLRRQYVGPFNARHRRMGTLWGGAKNRVRCPQAIKA